ncbi:sugar ABC transporter substrate-binding protein [Amycolatopsis cihanbeyliensis]|uniref:Ribose transport system substrate-binding protein n=1 Tax=Amycolatopsis cihanbeyliensis TaxID=1128664 RepID=A0A542CSI6_AMYCI|nr:sugar ABC transporter substrate-binding protein [Amycolatopsis cihanbeyliensis]TQI93785.1 ribose transport system substrate-binding protein [Amycolatopsis cihanbeyliensis]
MVVHPRTTKPRTRLAAGACALLLVACQSPSGGDDSQDGTLQLAFSYASTSQNPFQEMAFGAQAAATDAGEVELTANAPSSIDGPGQVSQFQSAIRTSADGIALQTLTPDLFVRPLRQANEADVPVVAVDTVPPEGTDVGLYVGNSNTELGRELGRELLEHIPEDAEGYVVLGNDIPGLALLEQRLAGTQEVLEQERPGLSIRGPFDAGSEPSVNFNKWNDIVKAHPDAIAYIGAGASDAVSLSLIQKNTGQRFLVGSCDPDPQALLGVKDGYVAALASPEHWLKGYVAVRMLAESARTGEPLPQGWWNTGSLIINSENIDEIMARQENEAARKEWFADEATAQVADPQAHLRPLDEAN